MKRLLIALALALGTLCGAQAPAMAQGCGINQVPQVGVICATQKAFTYSTAVLGLVPASAATDLFCISGSASRSISIKEIDISGYGTTAITEQMTILRRQALDTGTVATTTANPQLNAAVNLTGNPSPLTAGLSAYTANPTIVDSNPTYLRNYYFSFPTSANLGTPLQIIFGSAGTDEYLQAADILKGKTNEEICLNMNAGTVAGGLLAIDATWSEN